MMSALLSAWALLGLATASVYGGQQSAIVAGAPEAGWPAVVALVRDDAQGAYVGAFCTGALIDAEWVLTAAHCLVPNERFVPQPSRVRVYLGADATQPAADGGQLVPVAALIPHPDYQALGGLNDVGLVHLAAPVADVTPLPLSPAQLGPTFLGAAVTHVGFGVSDGVLLSGGGLKRRTTLTIDYIGDHTYVSEVAAAGICFGDSGGPAILESPDGARIIGVNAAVAGCAVGGGGCDPCAQAAVITRVDPLLAWLDETRGVASADCAAEPARCRCPAACGVDGRCDDSLCAQWGCGALYACASACPDGGSGPCAAGCLLYGTSEGLGLYDALARCLRDACGAVPGDPACAARNCPWQLENCAVVPVARPDASPAEDVTETVEDVREEAGEDVGAGRGAPVVEDSPDAVGAAATTGAEAGGCADAGRGAWRGGAAWLVCCALVVAQRGSRRGTAGALRRRDRCAQSPK